MTDFASGLVKLADFRGYTTYAHEDFRFRAWDVHHDGGREPERKIMVLLHDVEPGCQEMMYFKSSERWWADETQKDANFTLSEALQLSKSKSITRCYGPKGTVIIFTGQGLHRATRGLKDRSVLVFTYKKDVEGASFYPLQSIPPSVQRKISGSLVGHILRANESRINVLELLKSVDPIEIDHLSKQALRGMVLNEQDTTLTESDEILKQYNSAPRVAAMRKLVFENTDLSESIVEIFRNDVHSDLDLVVRDGNDDTYRNVLRVKLREYKSNSAATERLRQRLSEIQFKRFKLSELREYKNLLKSLANEVSNWDKSDYGAYLLCSDLEVAMAHCDAIEDLRVNVAFCYLIADYILEFCRKSGEDTMLTSKRLNELVSDYVFIVLIHDMSQGNVDELERSSCLFHLGKKE
jgi:hypothetical protein